MTKTQTDYALIKQMRVLHQQAERQLSQIIPVQLNVDNATLVQVWRSTQTTEIKGKRVKTIIYNN